MDEKDKLLNELRRELKYWKGEWHDGEEAPEDEDTYFVLWERCNPYGFNGPFYGLLNYDPDLEKWERPHVLSKNEPFNVVFWKFLPDPRQLFDKIMEVK